MSEGGKFELAKFPVHLGLGSVVVRQEEFTGAMDWYERYGARHAADGVEGRLVSLHSFASPWDSWEMHPSGDELVICVAGEITLIRELDGVARSVTLTPGEAVVNPPGVWHTADVATSATALFITAGIGTRLRARS